MELELEFESLHLLVLLCTAVMIIIADHDGFQYLRGKKQLLGAKRVHLLHRLVWIGLALMIATGAVLLLDEPDVFEEPAFYVKMLMVAALVVNSFAIGKFSRVASERPFAELTDAEKRKLFLSGAISGICWVGAAFVGLFLL